MPKPYDDPKAYCDCFVRDQSMPPREGGLSDAIREPVYLLDWKGCPAFAGVTALADTGQKQETARPVDRLVR